MKGTDVIIETERLVLRKFVLEDLDGLFELDSNPLVHRYLGNQPVKDKTELVSIIEMIQQQYKDNGVGRLAAIEKTSGEFIGWSGLKFERNNIGGRSNYYDLGYRLIPKFWNKGYATESALASLIYGFETLNLTEIFAAAHVENEGSNKVLTKIGMNYIETFQYDGDPHNWYNIEYTQCIAPERSTTSPEQ